MGGVRVDAVAAMVYLDYSRAPGAWVPNVHGGRENLEAIYFLKRFNEVSYERFPGIMTIPEESTAWPGVSRPTFLGGVGIGFQWQIGWLPRFLVFLNPEPVSPQAPRAPLPLSLLSGVHGTFPLSLSP